jgi:membrane-bound lytic murein transglycosylase A
VPGPNGTLGVPLTPKASLAIDARLNALGAPFFVVAEGRDPVQALMIGQDTGGAIAGAVRGDIFFGFGEEAEQRAGFMNAQGRLYVLLPNELAAQIGPGRDYSP